MIKLKLNWVACFIISSKCSRDGTQTASASSFLTLAGAVDSTQRMARMQEKMCSILQAQKQQSSPESSQKLLIIDHRTQHMTDRRAEELENKASRCVFVLGSFIIGLYPAVHHIWTLKLWMSWRSGSANFPDRTNNLTAQCYAYSAAALAHFRPC